MIITDSCDVLSDRSAVGGSSSLSISKAEKGKGGLTDEEKETARVQEV